MPHDGYCHHLYKTNTIHIILIKYLPDNNLVIIGSVRDPAALVQV